MEIPARTGTWCSIPQFAVLKAVEDTLFATVFGIRARRLALSANSMQFFATLDRLERSL